ncbi:MAG: hypothetical protein QOG55_3026, partial [Acidobacteriaceae bacterium]|nr:hypothetical protein [Acidobacteriaceae bacterium]
MAFNKGLKSFKNTLAVLGAEMALPAITSSALRAMHHFAQNHHHRKLLLIDSFHGYGCNWCGCRFPETRVVVHGSTNDSITGRVKAVSGLCPAPGQKLVLTLEDGRRLTVL